MRRLRIGTRGSRLALQQAAFVEAALLRADDGIETQIVILRTKGDRIQDKPLSEIGDKGVFASEFEQALQEGRIDLAVHSAKDLPMTLAEGLTIAAVLERADVRDVLVTPRGGRMPLLREGSAEDDGGTKAAADLKMDDTAPVFIIGSGSRRRQLLAGQRWKNVRCENIRGNVETRLRKLQEGAFDGIILAKAGLDRLGIDRGPEKDFAFYPLPPEQFVPAACQGIIAVEAVCGSETEKLCRKITDAETALCFQVEREVLRRLAADCSEAAAAWCRRDKDVLVLDAMYAGQKVRFTGRADRQDGRRMAAQAAESLKMSGG